MAEQNINLSITPQQFNTILAAMATRPYQEVAAVINEIVQQAQRQQPQEQKAVGGNSEFKEGIAHGTH